MTACSRCGTKVPPASRFCLQCGTPVTDPGAETMIFEPESDGLLALVRESLAADYEVDIELGRGGMAVVYKATEAELHRRVALKVLPPELSISRSIAERFKREARMAASLDHPNIIPIYRVGQTGRLFYIAMKFIDGRGLGEIIETQGALPVPAVLHVLRSAASALSYAHERGIVHRDVKCANILIDRDGRVVVSDFGIARAIEEPTMTAPGAVVGTPYFMSPEQCAARRIGPQSDQYSLGVVLFQMLTGNVPFHSETLPGIMHHHFYSPVPDVTAARSDVPPGLRTVLERALAKKPEERYATTGAMLAAVEDIPFSAEDRRIAESMLASLALGAPLPKVVSTALPPLPRITPANLPSVPTPPARRRRLLTWAAMALAAVGVAGAAIVGLRPTPAPPTLAVNAPALVPLESAVVHRTAPAPTSTSTPVPARAEVTRPASRGDTRSSREAETRDSAPPIAPRRAAAPAPPRAEMGRVRVRAFPSDARILVDQRLLGVGAVVDSLLASGERRLRVEAPGYAPFDTVISVRSGETTTVRSITLVAAEGGT